MKRSVIFDLDGTLWDTTEEVEKVWLEVAKKYELEIDTEKVKKIMGLTKTEIVNFLFKDNSEEGNKFITECQEMENYYLGIYGGKIYKNTMETLKTLHENEFDLYIVSNCQAGYIESFLKYYKLSSYIKDYECSGNTGKNKDENIKDIIERNNLINAVYVGDTEKDYIATKSNGIAFIWAKYGFGKCNNADRSIEDIADLLYELL